MSQRETHKRISFIGSLGRSKKEQSRESHFQRLREHGKRAITADTALRLGRYFGIESEFWMNLQTHYDLEVQSDRLAGKLEQEVKIHSAA